MSRACRRRRCASSSPSASGAGAHGPPARTRPRRAGGGRVPLEQLACSGACDALIGVEPGERADADRRTALWQLGLASPAVGLEDRAEPGASASAASRSWQLALPLELPSAPPLRKLGRWQRLIADYSTTGVTVGDH